MTLSSWLPKPPPAHKEAAVSLRPNGLILKRRRMASAPSRPAAASQTSIAGGRTQESPRRHEHSAQRGRRPSRNLAESPQMQEPEDVKWYQLSLTMANPASRLTNA
jgi:hypothetical protein